jgi:energy-coupling factor transporter ATP-binding protein EcfA2
MQCRILSSLRRVPGLTRIVASHRASALSLVDRTYRFERGRVIAVEAGRPALPVDSQPISQAPRGHGSTLFRQETLARFHSAEPPDRMPRLAAWFGRA